MPTLPLRPINAIFVHPKDRYYVVLMQGDNPERYELHRVSRMKLDGTSWQRRTPYAGNIDDLKLVKDQRIAESQLQRTITTENLPATLHGRTVSFFLNWWQNNGYEWHQNNHSQTDKPNAQSGNLSQIQSQTEQHPNQQLNPNQNSATQSRNQTASKSVNTLDNANTEPKPHSKPKSSDNTLIKGVTNTKSEKNNKPADNNQPVGDDFFDNMLADLDEL